MERLSYYFHTSIGRKQAVAVTGLGLILFVIAHLAGNLFIYGGPAMYNAYAEKLASLRPGLYVLEIGLLYIFCVHMYLTALLVMDNIKARGAQRYAVSRSVGERSLSARLMPFTGAAILAFVIWHLLDFTFVDHHGIRSVLPDGISYGIYGVVYNAFRDPVHSSLYILAMICVGTHLHHGIESFIQTFGFEHSPHVSRIKTVSQVLAVVITLGYSSIPIYVLVDSHRFRPW